MNKEVQLVIFDMDGLMFDTERLSNNCWIESGKELGFDMDISVLEKTIGRNIIDTRAIIMEAYGESFPFEKARAGRDRLLVEYVQTKGTPVKAGLFELLDYLDQKKIKRAVATSTERARAEILLSCAGILDRFDTVICGDMVQRGKPFPDIFQKAAQVCGCPEDSCVVLEDSPAGVEAAWRCGMPVFFVQDVIRLPPDVKEKYTDSLADLNEMIPILSRA